MDDNFLEQAWVTWKMKYLTGDVPLLELYSLKLAFVAGWYAAQQGVQPTGGTRADLQALLTLGALPAPEKNRVPPTSG